MIQQGVPLNLGWSHGNIAWGYLAVLLFTMHSCKRVDPRHIKNLFGKLKMENPEAFKVMISKHDKTMMSRKTFE